MRNPVLISSDFENYVQAKENALKNAWLTDIRISTSAAPTYFPAHYFEIRDESQETRSFDLVDGEVAANNPVSSMHWQII